MSDKPPVFEVNAFAEAAQAEVIDDMRKLLVELEKKHDGDAYKAVVTANVMIANGVTILINRGICPDDLMDVIAMMVQGAIDGDEGTHFAIPADVADLVMVKEGKPS